MKNLNEQQAQAIKYIDSPLLVLAGAGSGKTSVITNKIIYLIEKCNYKPHNIYAVTFTNKAASEMQHRVQQKLKNKRGLVITTFHRLGLKILRKSAEKVNLNAKFSLFDVNDCIQLLKQIAGDSLQNDKSRISELQTTISNWKNNSISPEQSLELAKNNLDVADAKIYFKYQQYLNAYNAVDFDDLINLPLLILQRHPEILNYWQNKIHYLLIDEYQDTNLSQYQLVKLICQQRQAFTVVGDDDQSIYAWRGARPDNLKKLQDDFPIKVIKLEQNYRSTARILRCANHLIANNEHLFDKKLWCQLAEGTQIRILATDDEYKEAEQIIAEIVNDNLQTNTPFHNYAILYRNNYQSRLFETCLKEHKIPYQISGSTSFLSKTEIKDILAYLKLIANPDDDAAFLRIINVPKRGIGSNTLKSLAEYAKNREVSLLTACNEIGIRNIITEKIADKLYNFANWLHKIGRNHETIVELTSQIIKDIEYQDWLFLQTESVKTAEKQYENILFFINWLEKLAKKLADEDGDELQNIIQRLILLDILDMQKEQELEQVQLMTLHASKGLEFKKVYLVGVEEGVLPHQNSIDQENIEEERRLAYVGITRAKEDLVISYACKRRKQGENVEVEPSRFLKELPKSEIYWQAKDNNPEISQKIANDSLAQLKDMFSDE